MIFYKAKIIWLTDRTLGTYEYKRLLIFLYVCVHIQYTQCTTYVLRRIVRFTLYTYTYIRICVKNRFPLSFFPSVLRFWWQSKDQWDERVHSIYCLIVRKTIRFTIRNNKPNNMTAYTTPRKSIICTYLARESYFVVDLVIFLIQNDTDI